MKFLVLLFILCLTINLVIANKNRRKSKTTQITSSSNFSIGDNLWPNPQQFRIEQIFYSIEPKNFRFVLKTNGKCDLLDKTIDRYMKLLFLEDCSLVSDKDFQTLYNQKKGLKENNNFGGNLQNVIINVLHKCESDPPPEMDETYSIRINKEQAYISANNVWGVIRAIETFSQLIENVGLNQFIINMTAIDDFPRFKFRGLLLDTSRHYIPVERLKQSLDAMAYNKMNVFHWHIVDDQSFPYVSQVFPEMSLKGAYNPKTHIYTIKDIKHIIEYAKERGIRVIVEFDTPGHTLAWGKGQPGLLTTCYNEDKPNGNFGPIDPTKESSYSFIKTLFTEVVNIFSDQYFHLGGDEVDYNCWNSNPNVIQFMKSKNIIKKNQNISKRTDDVFHKLEEYYIQKIIDIVKDLNKSSIVWQEVFDNKARIQSDTIIHIWKLQNWESELFNVTKKGYQTILSSCWYLNKISYGTDWHKYYNCDPHSFKGNEQQNRLVIGGEATMWGEWVDGSNIIGRTWPRAIAVAERLWSSKNMKSPWIANRRFNRQHCLMQKRGIKVEPSNGVGSCQCDHLL